MLPGEMVMGKDTSKSLAIILHALVCLNCCRGFLELFTHMHMHTHHTLSRDLKQTRPQRGEIVSEKSLNDITKSTQLDYERYS